ncbi:hypothetical protein BDV98DRAFT_515337, partial [Pterulicium gracile]
YISAIIRTYQQLTPLTPVCPIGDSLESPALGSLKIWVASTQTTITNLVIASQVPAFSFLSHTRVVCLPGFTTSIREELDVLREVDGEEALKLVQFEEDETNKRVVSSWPAVFDNGYAVGLGFQVDEGGMLEVVRRFKEEVVPGIA